MQILYKIIGEGMFSEEEISGALELLKIAKNDFEAAKLLLENDFYPQGLFFLQQSIEKATKAILRALGLADTESLKKEIGHDVLVKGLKEIGYRAIEVFRSSISDQFINNLPSFCTLFTLCPEAFRYINEIFKATEKGATIIQEWLDRKYDKEIRKIINTIGNTVFRKNDEDVRNKLDRVFDGVQFLVSNIAEAVKQIGAEDIIISYWKYVDSLTPCIKKHTKNRAKLAEIKKGIEKYNNMFRHLMARVIYLLDVYILLLVYHTLFENRVSMLRYPNKGWTPLTISKESTIVVEAMKIIDFMQSQKILHVLENFIKGEITQGKSKEVYTALAKYIETLRNMTKVGS